MKCEHILVDGWNAIHADQKLAKLFEADAGAARRGLAEILEPVHDMRACRVSIVYDGSGADISISHPDGAIPTFSEVFTSSDMTADEFIERYCALAKNPSAIVVISNDNMIWQTVSVLGAVCMRVDEIFRQSKAASGDIKRISSRINFEADRKWREGGALAKIDELALEVNRVKSSLFTSKKMLKKLGKAKKHQ